MNKKHLLILSSLLFIGSCFSAYEIMSDISISNPNVVENTLSGTELGSLNTLGGEGGYIYELVNGTNTGDTEKFYLSGDRLYLNFTPDYENPISSGGTNSYTIRIKSTDSTIPVFAKDISSLFNANGGWFYNAGVFGNIYGFAGIRPDGSIIARGSKGAIGDGTIGNMIPTDTGYIQIIGNYKAFLAIKADGSMSDRGYQIGGGTGNIVESGFTGFVANGEAFAALKPDGSITAWGHAGMGGDGAPTGTGYVKIFPNRFAFAALKPDGSITAWGRTGAGGDGAPTGTGYVKIYGNNYAFAAMKANGSISARGSGTRGGSGAPTGTGYVKIYGNNYAFAALKTDGSISVWGTAGRGGNAGPSGTGYVDIFGNGNAFAAVKSDGSITAWGHTSYGGTGAPTRSGYTKVIGGGNAYAALKDDGSIATRGWGAYGGIGGPTGTGYIDVFSTYQAFAALKDDGSITAWGNGLWGGSGAPTDTGYINILSLDDSFLGVKADGSVKGWGTTINNRTPGTIPQKLGAILTKDITINITDFDEIPPTATVSYSPSSNTYGNVLATVNLSEPGTITNNGGSSTFSFNENGEFTFEFTDLVGLTGNVTAKVDWINGQGAGVIIVKDDCPDGDTSASYYDKICKPTSSGGENSGGTPSIIGTGSIGATGNIKNEIFTGNTGSVEIEDELITAYKRAYEKKITTMPTIEEARVGDPLTRAEMAKMIVNYAISNLGKKIDTSKQANFTDLNEQTNEMKNYINQAYQLGLMGINVHTFNPNGFVTRGEFATVVARLLYNTVSDTNEAYYTKPIKVLNEKGIIKNTNPLLQEARGYVMLMLMRASK